MVEKKVPNEHLVPSERIGERIYFVRGQKVMLDEDMAELYEVPTRRLNEQVTRNAGRFPVDFMFRLTAEEVSALRSQNSISKIGGEVDDIRLVPSRNKGWPCCRAS